MKIWQRHIVKQLLSTFILVLLCLFAIYILVDFSIRCIRFTRGNTSALAILFYYLRSFAVQLDLFLPLAFLLTILKVLFNLTSRLELLSLQMAGLSKKRILFPFFAFAFLLSAACYANHEYLMPSAGTAAKEFKAAHSKKKTRGGEHLYSIALDDGSKLVYHTLNERIFSDVFWLRSSTDFWHFKTLLPPLAHFADHFVRENGKLIKKESFEEKDFPEISMHSRGSLFIPLEARAISTLVAESLHQDRAVLVHLHHKLAKPLLFFLILLAVAPFAMVVSRQRPVFLIVSLSLFGFLVVLMLFDSLLIVGPWLAMWIVPAIIFALTFRKFAKL